METLKKVIMTTDLNHIFRFIAHTIKIDPKCLNAIDDDELYQLAISILEKIAHDIVELLDNNNTDLTKIAAIVVAHNPQLKKRIVDSIQFKDFVKDAANSSEPSAQLFANLFKTDKSSVH